MTAVELTKPAPTSLVIRRTFDAPVERVFNAWLTPEALRFMLTGEQNKVLDATVDARAGGSYRITWQTPEGVWTCGGVYREVVKNERIVCTWTWEEDDPADVQETLLTLEFRPLSDAKTELVLTHTNFRTEASRDSHGEGWSTAVERLAQRLERG
jgi:uncharacterized protein YndB with AHSA1/START domain